jgi:hypothetical protein
MPIFTSQAIGSVKGLGFTSSSATYFVGYYNTTADQALGYPSSISATPSGFVYLASQTGSVNKSPTVVGINKSGNLVFQNKYGTGGSQNSGGQIDADGNVITVGAYAIAATRNAIYKCNSAGTFVASSGINTPSSNSGNTNCYIDSSGNIHIAGSNGSATPAGIYLKYNSSFTLLNQYNLTLSGSTLQAVGIGGDSSGNIYITGYAVITSVYYIFLIKLDSAGAIVWQYKYAFGTTATMSYQNLAVDSSGNIYVATTLSTEIILSKFDSSGTEQWSKRSNQSPGIQATSLVIDPSSTYLYVGATNGAKGITIKYDLSGNLQWARSLSIGATSLNSAFFAVNSFACYTLLNVPVSSVAKSAIGCFPTDGSKTGTYSVSGITFTYAAETITQSTPTLTRTTLGATKSNASFTETPFSNATSAVTATFTSTIT